MFYDESSLLASDLVLVSLLSYFLAVTTLSGGAKKGFTVLRTSGFFSSALRILLPASIHPAYAASLASLESVSSVLSVYSFGFTPFLFSKTCMHPGLIFI